MKTKPAFFLIALLLPFTARAEVGAWQKDFDVLLKKYVVGDGVRYAAWKASAPDVAALGKIVAAIGAEDPSGLGRNDRLAFYINAYNAWMIHLVLEKYPIRSVRNYAPLFGVFTGKHIRLGGKKISLNHLEKELILKGIGEPRAHFAVNCASRSCPPLRPEPYTGAKLEAQLDEQTRAFVNSGNGVKARGQTAELSRIFDWYKEDFGGESGVLDFLKKTRKDGADFKSVKYQDYDWSLNEAK